MKPPKSPELDRTQRNPIQPLERMNHSPHSQSESFGGNDGIDDWGLEKNPFPIECLPGIAGEIAREIARVTTCQNKSLAATTVLGILSASIGASLEVTTGPNRKTRANLFILAVAQSGTGKSENFQLAAKPLDSIEAAAMKIWEETQEPEIRSMISILEARAKKLTNNAANATESESRKRLSVELREVETDRKNQLRKLAARPCFRVGDVTKEALAILIQAQPGEAISSMSSEARGIVAIINGRYSPGGDIDFYCAGYSGDSIKVDRVKNENTIFLGRPCLSVVWMVQPDVVITALSQPAMSDSGFLARFIMFDSYAEAQERLLDATPISPSITGRWQELIMSLCTLRSANESADVLVSDEAYLLFHNYENECIRGRKSDGDFVDILPYASRWAENAWRIGLVLHAANHGRSSADVDLSAETAEAAIRLMRWYSTKQLEILRKSKRERSENRMEELVRTLKKAGDGSITLRNLQKNNGFKDEEVRSLVRLFPRKLSINTSQKKEGGRPTVIVSLTPDRQNRQYPQNSQPKD